MADQKVSDPKYRPTRHDRPVGKVAAAKHQPLPNHAYGKCDRKDERPNNHGAYRAIEQLFETGH